ncbi:hypothetical protein BS50DRAFT_636234 [Corynespora cassiicola Philippines]|uniref:Uncharacterized protein n=1 Tax=Corynespora cassiicola Philippines TaxID=1448308 RepID=A0A2T2NJ95_CORCC|nr:hypothetical protein BS50DRAFT_636234 [Corynespora cassiicola Philippines]
MPPQPIGLTSTLKTSDMMNKPASSRNNQRHGNVNQYFIVQSPSTGKNFPTGDLSSTHQVINQASDTQGMPLIPQIGFQGNNLSASGGPWDHSLNVNPQFGCNNYYYPYHSNPNQISVTQEHYSGNSNRNSNQISYSNYTHEGNKHLAEVMRPRLMGQVQHSRFNIRHSAAMNGYQLNPNPPNDGGTFENNNEAPPAYYELQGGSNSTSYGNKATSGVRVISNNVSDSVPQKSIAPPIIVPNIAQESCAEDEDKTDGLYFNDYESAIAGRPAGSWSYPRNDSTIPMTNVHKQRVVLRILRAIKNLDGLWDKNTGPSLNKRWFGKKNFYGNQVLEVTAWQITEFMIRLHIEGPNIMRTNDPLKVETASRGRNLTFGERLDAVVYILHHFKARCDSAVSGDYENLITNPSQIKSCSLANRTNNDVRQNRLSEAREHEAKEPGDNPAPRRRGRGRKPKPKPISEIPGFVDGPDVPVMEDEPQTASKGPSPLTREGRALEAQGEAFLPTDTLPSDHVEASFFAEPAQEHAGEGSYPFSEGDFAPQQSQSNPQVVSAPLKYELENANQLDFHRAFQQDIPDYVYDDLLGHADHTQAPAPVVQPADAHPMNQHFQAPSHHHLQAKMANPNYQDAPHLPEPSIQDPSQSIPQDPSLEWPPYQLPPSPSALSADLFDLLDGTGPLSAIDLLGLTEQSLTPPASFDGAQQGLAASLGQRDSMSPGGEGIEGVEQSLVADLGSIKRERSEEGEEGNERGSAKKMRLA